MDRSLRLVASFVIAVALFGGLFGCSSTATTTLPTNQRMSSTGSVPASQQTLSTIVEVSPTSTTLPPGVMTFDTCASIFEKLLERKQPAGTLPFSVIAPGELTWLSADAVPVTITHAKGYRLANGDIVILFFYAPYLRGDASFRAAEQAITGVAKKHYAQTRKDVYAYFPYIDEFGYVVATNDPASPLGRLAEMSRTGEGADILSLSQ